MNKIFPKTVRDVAIAAIKEAGKPIGTKEILEFAQRNGFRYMLKGKTPRQSIQAIIWRDINARDKESPFLMIGAGRRNRKYYLRKKFLH
jgi:hypothetical protein